MAKNKDLFAPPTDEELNVSASQEDIFAPPTEEERTPPDAVSKLESAARGAGQGVTLGFLDELMATLGTKGASPSQVIAEPKKAVETERAMMQQYEKNLAEERAANKAAEEANPMTYMGADLVGGVLPGLLSGGGAAAANVLKTGSKEALKEGAKLGAKYGAVSGAGYSEADDLEGLATDVALGTGLGGVAGAALPLAAKGAAAGYKGVKKGTQNLLETVIPESDAIKAGFKYGLKGKKISQDVLDEDVMDISKNILKNIKSAKKSNKMQDVKDSLDALGYKVDTKKTINKAIKDLEKLQKGDVLDLQNKDLLPKLKQLAGQDIQGQKLAQQAERQAIKKAIENEGKINQAVIKGEKDLAKKAIQTGDDLQTITDINRPMSDLELPLTTSEGRISGTAGKFKNAEGEEYIAKSLSDATEYQPEISKLVGPDGRPIIKTVDKGTGRVAAIVGNVEDKLQQDLSNMSISEVENLRKQINLATNLAKVSGGADDPVMQRAQGLAKELKDLTDDVIERSGNTELIDKRQKFSDLFSAEELLGVNKRLSVRGDLDELQKAKVIGEKLGFEKGFGTRQETQKAQELLGKEVVTPEMKQNLELLRKLNQISGRESQENISRAGLYKMAVGDIPNIAGRITKKAQDFVKPVTSPVKNTIDLVNTMTKEQVGKLGNKFASSESKGASYLGKQLLDASQREGEAYNQAVWALSQSPAFRELMKREIPAMEEEMRSDLGITEEPLTGQMSREIESENTREPAMSEFLKEKEGGTALTGYVPKRSSKSGVTIATGLDLGNFDLNKLNLSEELKQKLTPYIGLRGDDAQKVAGNLIISEQEAQEIDKSLDEFNSKKVEKKLEDLPQEYNNERFKEGLESMTHNIPSGAKKLIDRIKKGNIDEAIDKGVEYNKTGGRFASGLLQRRMEELYKMFPERADLIQKEGEIEYNKYKGQTKRSWDDINTIEEKVKETEKEIDRVNQLQSSGDAIPLPQLESLLQKIDTLKMSQEDKDTLENEAVNMQSFSDGERLKELLRKIQGIS